MDLFEMAKVAEGVARREYSLLLGAGASMGSIGGNGEPLPSGPNLRDKLVSEFRIPTSEDVITLSRAYAAAKRKNPDRLEEFIGSWFTGCTPDWQHLLADFDWHRIWTLNIDDIIEAVFHRRGTKIDRFDWTSRFRDKPSAGTQIVHLHGFADKTSDGRVALKDLVFSINEYSATSRDPRSWHTVFTDEFAERPFIVLGASLVEEFDLQQALTESAAATTRGFPCVIVLKRVSELQREELSDMGLMVIEADAQEFMKQLYDEVRKYRTTLQGTYGQVLSPETSRFLQQFTDLRLYQPNQSENSRNFYLGYEPQWRNILDDDDAVLETTESSLALIRAASGRGMTNQSIHILVGSSGVGKSTGLLRIARSFVGDGVPVFLFRGEEDLDVAATMYWLNRFPETMLFFNDCADFADSLGELAEKCASAHVRLAVVGAERSVRRNQLEHKIDPKFLAIKNEYTYSTLSNRDIESLINKLGSRRRLGRVTSYNRNRQRDYFKKTASGRLFEGMASLEGGQGFKARVQNDYSLIKSGNLKRLYAASSIAYEIGHPLPIGVSSKISGLSVKELENRLVSDEQDSMIIETSGVRLPHRLTASMVVESALSAEDKFEAMRGLLWTLAPHIDIQAIRHLTRPYRLVRRLMDQETVMRLLGPLRGRELYEMIQEPYDWNGRYWEQRALFESELGNHAQARSYAEHSLRIHRHPFALNTLGTVLGRIALQNGDVDTLREAIKNLELARDGRRWEASEHPYITFFATMIKFGETWGLPAVPTQLRNEVAEWHRRARTSQVFLSKNGESQLQEFQRQWLGLAT